MSYYDQQNQQAPQQRPGFSAPQGGFEGFLQSQAQPQPVAPAPQQYSQPAAQQSGYSGGNQSGGYNNSGGSGDYSGGNRQGGYGGGGNQGGWNRGGNGGGGGWNRGGGGGGGWKGKGGGGGGFNRQPLSPEQLAALKMPKSVLIDGNARAPEQLVPLIREIADMFRRAGFELRTGGMDGLGKLVSDNVPDVELHLPWKDFNQIPNAASSFNSDECKEYAKRYLPDWGNLKDSHQAFYCKNVRLVLGKSLKQPCQIAIIWSEDGVEGENTRTQQSMHAGHIAAMCRDMRIPVINLHNPDAVSRVRKFLEGQLL